MNKEKINILTKRLLDVTLSDCLVMSTFEVFTNMKNYVPKNLSEYEMEELKAQISFFNEEERSIEISLIYRRRFASDKYSASIIILLLIKYKKNNFYFS